MTAPVQIDKRNVSKTRREKTIAAQGGICKRAHCDTPAVDVDHIIPLWAGGSNRDDNLEGLCGSCHQIKTKAEASARAKAKRRSGETGQRARRERRGKGSIPARVDPWGPKGVRKIPSAGFARKSKRERAGTEGACARSEPHQPTKGTHPNG